MVGAEVSPEQLADPTGATSRQERGVHTPPWSLPTPSPGPSLTPALQTGQSSCCSGLCSLQLRLKGEPEASGPDPEPGRFHATGGL